MASITEVNALSADTLAFLSSNRTDGSVSSGMRRLRRGILRECNDETSWNEELEIPVIINSIEALRFIGLKKTAARVVLDNFERSFVTNGHRTSSLVTSVYDLIDFAVGHLEGKGDAIGPEEDWEDTLKALGII